MAVFTLLWTVLGLPVIICLFLFCSILRIPNYRAFFPSSPFNASYLLGTPNFSHIVLEHMSSAPGP